MYKTSSRLGRGTRPNSVVPADYQAPFAFNGEIKSVTLDVTGDLIVDHESEHKRIMAQQ